MRVAVRGQCRHRLDTELTGGRAAQGLGALDHHAECRDDLGQGHVGRVVEPDAGSIHRQTGLVIERDEVRLESFVGAERKPGECLLGAHPAVLAARACLRQCE